MDSISMILFGIAALIIALCGAMMWLVGLKIGPFIFFISITIGVILCFKGLFIKNKDE